MEKSVEENSFSLCTAWDIQHSKNNNVRNKENLLCTVEQAMCKTTATTVQGYESVSVCARVCVCECCLLSQLGKWSWAHDSCSPWWVSFMCSLCRRDSYSPQLTLSLLLPLSHTCSLSLLLSSSHSLSLLRSRAASCCRCLCYFSGSVREIFSPNSHCVGDTFSSRCSLFFLLLTPFLVFVLFFVLFCFFRFNKNKF